MRLPWAVGAKLIFLPPYSPDLKPIEQMFAKLKTLQRKANARTIEAVTEAIKKLLDEYPVEERANYFSIPVTGQPKTIAL
jgi:transposase